MLEPDYFYGKSDKLVEMYQELEDWIIKDIAMRLLTAGEMSGTADRELYKLQQMGLHRQEIVKRLSKLTGKSQEEIRRLLSDSAITSFSNDREVLQHMTDVVPPLQNSAVIMVLNAELSKTVGELGNLTRTTMMQSQRDLINMMNEVDFRVASGMQSYSSAVCEVLDRYAKSGVMVDYPTGAKRTLEAAVRCCVVTSMNQTAAEVTNQYIIQNKIEYVVVSEHPGARHNEKDPEGVSSHDWWQGRAYKIRGSEPDFPNLLESTGYDIDAEKQRGRCVDLLGLHGYNCRHSHGPWSKELGVSKPKVDREKSQKVYELQQKQRAMERAIRTTKRELLAKQLEIDGIAETDVKEILQPQYDKLAYRLRMQNKKYQEFCKANDLQTQAERIKVAGFKRAQSARANGRATAYSNSLSDNDTEDIFSVLQKKTTSRVNKMFEHEPLCINEIQGKYADEIRNIIEKAPENVKNVIDRYADEIRFVNEKVIGKGHTNKRGIYVNFKKDSINERGAWTTTFHEMGHAIDIASNRISYKYPYFKECLEKDFNCLVKAYQKEYNLTKDEAYLEIGKALEPCEYHILSDLSGAITNNQCKGKYVHSDINYWKKPHMLEKEAFAHFFGAMATNSSIKISAIKAVFPSAFEEFEKLLEEIK